MTHTRGPLLEEDHYYPFALTMAGISDKAIKSSYAENKYRFQKQELQDKEFFDGSGLEWYEFKYRMDDPQIGRFWSVDPLANKYVYYSPYAFSGNRVTSFVELEGLEPVFSNLVCPECQTNDGENKEQEDAAKARMDDFLGKALGTLFSPFNLMGSMHAAGNAHNPQAKAALINEAKQEFTETILNVAGGMLLERLGNSVAGGFMKDNPFKGLTSINDIGTTGESLTKGILQSQFKDANIYEHVTIKMDGATFVADHVVVQDGKVTGVFESKVGDTKLSNGQKLFFNDGETGVMTGKNIPEALRGMKVDPKKVQKGVYRWSKSDASFSVQ